MALLRPAFVLFIAMSSIMCLPKVLGMARREKIWPDFSCHPLNEQSTSAHSRYNLAKNFWEDCLQVEKENGDCAKTCLLRRQNMVYQYCGPKCNVTVNVDTMGFRLSQQLGYEEVNQPEGDKLVRDVEQELAKCRDKHISEIVLLQTRAPCDDRWNPFLSCIDKAFGCVKN